MQTKTIQDILSAEIVTIKPQAHVVDVIGLMQARKISCVVIVKKSKPIGIVTERNVVELAGRGKVDYSQLSVGDIMTSPVLTILADVEVDAAYNILTTNNIRHLIVTDSNGHVIGLVTQSDIMEYLGYEYFVEIKKICQVMTKVVFSMPEDFSVLDALNSMARKGISCLVISRGKKPIGIITERDAARLLVDHDDLSQLKVADVMSSSIRTILNTTPLHNAVEFMKEHKLRRLVVVDKDGGIEGLATQSDIIKGLEAKYIESLNEMIRQKEDAIEKTSNDLAVKSVYLNNILKSSVDNGIIATDVYCNIKYFNPAAEKLLGLKEDDVLGRDLRQVLNQGECDQLDFDKVIEIVSKAKSHTVICEHLVQGKTRYIQAQSFEIIDDDGALNGFSLMLRDITARTNAEIDLRRTNDALEQRVLERTEKLAKAMEGTITAMAYAVEMRDPYTSGHQRRVADLATAIAVELGMEEDEVEGIQMAAQLHDIGKIRVPFDLLSYPGKLSKEEFALLKPHPVVGYDILKNIDFPWPIAEIIVQHHELMDGSGYPKGLSGDEIIMSARVVTVADVVEAMSSHRPYRPALGTVRALAEIKSGAGSRYDQQVSDACIRVFEKNKYEIL